MGILRQLQPANSIQSYFGKSEAEVKDAMTAGVEQLQKAGHVIMSTSGVTQVHDNLWSGQVLYKLNKSV